MSNPMESAIYLGNYIKLIRRNLKVTQKDVAESLNINYRYYQDIEGGKKKIRLDTFFKIINHFVPDMGQLIEKTGRLVINY